jgi:hypothetical protein
MGFFKIRPESVQVMHLRNNHVEVDASPASAEQRGWNHPEPSKIRILAIGSRDA